MCSFTLHRSLVCGHDCSTRLSYCYKYNFFAVPNIVQNVSIMRPSPTVLVVSWILLSYSEARGFISHYNIHYSPVTSEKRRQEVDAFNQTVPGMNNTTRIEGLDANSDYIVQVSATNGAGTSKLSAAVRADVPVEGMCTSCSSTSCVKFLTLDVDILRHLF